MIRETLPAERNGRAVQAGQATWPRHRLSGHYEALLRRLRHERANSSPPRAIGVTSCAGGEGASTVAANLAISAARTGCRVLLVDANIASPAVARALHVSPRPGLAELLSGEAEPEEAVHPTGVPNLFAIPAGPALDDDATGCDWSRLSENVELLVKRYDLVIFDLPPADELSPAAVIASVLDGAVLVVEADRTCGQAALRAKRQLQSGGAKLLGVVLNKGR